MSGSASLHSVKKFWRRIRGAIYALSLVLESPMKLRGRLWLLAISLPFS